MELDHFSKYEQDANKSPDSLLNLIYEWEGNKSIIMIMLARITTICQNQMKEKDC